VGFWYGTKKSSVDVFREPLVGIDMTQWHTYTILWEEDNSTFLVDGRVIKTLSSSPTEPLFGDIYLRNLFRGEDTGGEETWGYLDLAANISIQVDYFRLFATSERYQTWEEEISRAGELIAQAKARGIDTTELEEHYEEVNGVWQQGYCNYNLAKPHLELIIPYLERFDEMTRMFSACRALIQESGQEGVEKRTLTIMEGYYAQAEKNWGEYDQELAETNLQKILDMAEQ
jgi:hypothetical protein